MYTTALDMTDFPSQNYDSRKLKEGIEKHHELESKIAFTKNWKQRKLSFFLVISSDLSTDEAIQQVYEISTQDDEKDIALLLSGVILRSHKETKQVP